MTFIKISLILACLQLAALVSTRPISLRDARSYFNQGGEMGLAGDESNALTTQDGFSDMSALGTENTTKSSHTTTYDGESYHRAFNMVCNYKQL